MACEETNGEKKYGQPARFEELSTASQVAVLKRRIEALEAARGLQYRGALERGYTRCNNFLNGLMAGSPAWVMIDAVRADLVEAIAAKEGGGLEACDAGGEAAPVTQERDEARTQLEAWQCIFGTTQLTHAQARLEAAEKLAKVMADALKAVVDCTDKDGRVYIPANGETMTAVRAALAQLAAGVETSTDAPPRLPQAPILEAAKLAAEAKAAAGGAVPCEEADTTSKTNVEVKVYQQSFRDGDGIIWGDDGTVCFKLADGLWANKDKSMLDETWKKIGFKRLSPTDEAELLKRHPWPEWTGLFLRGVKGHVPAKKCPNCGKFAPMVGNHFQCDCGELFR